MQDQHSINEDAQNRMMEIEIKLSRQEDLLDTLNQLVYEQQKKIDQLSTLCSGLNRQLSEIASRGELGGISASHEKPPHY